jgi:hypothetical protein
LPEFLSHWPFWGEVAKAIATFIGALIIARLTVNWALGRYKAEKRWERETTAMTDLLSAMSELHRINGDWIDDMANDRIASPEDEDRRIRYQAARRRLEETLAAASILLPARAQDTVRELVVVLNRHYDTWSEALFETNEALHKGRAELVAFGRTRMEVTE